MLRNSVLISLMLVPVLHLIVSWQITHQIVDKNVVHLPGGFFFWKLFGFDPYLTVLLLAEISTPSCLLLVLVKHQW